MQHLLLKNLYALRYLFYNLILYQNSEFLTKLRQILAKTNYYDLWDEEYLKKILAKDYEMVKNLRNK